MQMELKEVETKLPWSIQNFQNGNFEMPKMCNDERPVDVERKWLELDTEIIVGRLCVTTISSICNMLNVSKEA